MGPTEEIMAMDQLILNFCLEKWNKSFCCANSLEVAGIYKIDHAEVRNAFRRLKNNRKGTIIDEIAPLPDTGAGEIEKEKGSATLFFPAKKELKKYYEANKSYPDVPPFTKAMHLGHRPFELWFFSDAVLNRYLKNSNKYNVEDSDFFGFFCTNKDYVSNLQLEQTRENCFSVKRYGKIHTNNGEIIIATILADLSELPADDQEYWFRHQTEAPALTDVKFQKNYLKFFRSVPVDSHDPLHDLIAILHKINSLQHVGRLFKNLDAATLKYPVYDSYENFRECCKELYKFISPDNINANLLKNFLRTNFHYQMRDLSFGEPQKNFSLFKLFLTKFTIFDNSIQELTGKVKNQNLLDFEKREKDFLMEFKKICEALLTAYRILYEELKVEKYQIGFSNKPALQ